MSSRIYRRNKRRMSRARRTREPIAAPTPKLSSTTPPPPEAAAALSIASAATAAAPTQAAPSRASRRSRAVGSLQAGTRRSIDQNASSATRKKPGRVHGRELVERRPLRGEEHRVLAAERRQAAARDAPGQRTASPKASRATASAAEPEREPAQVDVLHRRIRRQARRRDERDGSGR